MTLTLPSSARLRMTGRRLISSRNEMTPAFGGPDSRVNRLGSRWAMQFQIVTLSAADALDWIDLEDETSTVTIEIPQPGLSVGSPGTPVIDGAAQSGNAYAVRGVTPGYVMRKGQWLSVIDAGQRYVYQTRSAATADGLGDITIPLRPLIRSSVADGATVEIAQPMIEGFASLPATAFDLDNNAFAAGLSFLVKELA
tara:strand:- start:15784 stop:16374 length:591 start_codon:yes stop_codon:yes gene_type:complete